MKLWEISSQEVRGLTGKVVVLPLGSLEQHGSHLPLFTDSIICREVAGRAETELADEALFLPVVWTGASDHHLGFPGTVSVSNHTYVHLLGDLLESLVRSGFRRIFVLNAHGGNITPGRMAIYDVQMRHTELKELFIAFSSWWQIAADEIEAIPGLEQAIVTHACEQETSMILRLHPELVNMAAATGANIAFESAFYCPDFATASRVDVPRAFDQLSRTGAFGHPEVATAEKGEALFAAAAGEVVRFVREFATWPPIAPQ